jgi:class 3 adenylate cyclase
MSQRDDKPLYRLTCSGLILCVYRLLTSALGNAAREMINEKGHGSIPVTRAPPLVEDLYKKGIAIWQAKWELCEKLGGDEADKKLLRVADKLLGQLKSEVLDPVARIRTLSPANIAKIQAAGLIAASIVRAATPHRRKAEKRLRSALSTHSPMSVIKGVVISLDMARYSEFALDLPDFLNAAVLSEFNKNIQKKFANAIKSVGGNPGATPIANMGDGALVFLGSSELAVRFAVEIQATAFQRSLDVRKEARERRFRIGMAAGEYCLERYYDVAGQLSGFNTGGVSIIDAVRIQAKCPEGGVLISDAAFNELPEELKRDFERTQPITTKGHERRTIKVWKLKQPRARRR